MFESRVIRIFLVVCIFMQFKKETGLGEEERGGKMITQSCLLRKNNFSKTKLQLANHGAKRLY